MFKSSHRSSLFRSAVVAGLLAVALVPSMAFAATAGDLATNLFDQLVPFADLIMSAMFLVGIGVGGLSALKFKAHNENPQQVKVTTPIVLLLVAGALIGLPAYLTMTKETLLQDGQTGGLEGGAYQSIGGG